MRRWPALLLATALSACSQEQQNDIPPLAEPTAESTNQLMQEAERASADAATRAEPKQGPERSGADTRNEVAQ